jgi:hypothetical protein
MTGDLSVHLERLLRVLDAADCKPEALSPASGGLSVRATMRSIRNLKYAIPARCRLMRRHSSFVMPVAGRPTCTAT